MKNGLFFHIGFMENKEPYIQALLDLGYKIIILSETDSRPKNTKISYHSIIEKTYSEVLQIIENIANDKGHYNSDCFFFTLVDDSVNLVNQLLKSMNRPPISHFNGNIRDKFWARQRLGEEGIEHLPFVSLVRNPAEIPTPSKDFFPLIAKPTHSAGSQNVFQVNNNDELRKACLEIFTRNRPLPRTYNSEIAIASQENWEGFAVIESKLSGEELSFEALVHNGELLFFTITNKFESDNNFFIERADVLAPSRFTLDEKARFEIYITKIINALYIDSSILNIEVIYNRNKNLLNLIEVNFRLCGGRMTELIKSAYNIDLAAAHLDTISGASSGHHLKEFSHKNLESAWILFGFFTQDSGIFEAKKSEAFDCKIDWYFKNGELLSKPAALKFFMLGTIVFPTKPDQIETVLAHLRDDIHQYYSLKKPGFDGHSTPSEKLAHSSRDAVALLRLGIAVLYFTACFMGAGYLYRSFEAQSKLMGQTIAKILGYHLANGEIYYAANVLNIFETGKTYKRIVVTDRKNNVIYSTTASGSGNLFYHQKIKPSDYDQFLPIKVDGMDVGALAYDVNHRAVLGQLLAGFILISALVAGMYFVIAKYLLDRLAASAKEEAEDFVAIVDNLKHDLERFHERNSLISFESYHQRLSAPEKNNTVFTGLRHSLLKFVTLLRTLRDGVLKMSDLLDESTKQLIHATAQAEIAKVTSQLAHDIRKPFSQLQAVMDQFATYQANPSMLGKAREEVRKSMRNVESMVNDIMDYSREVQVETHPVALTSVLDFSLRQVLLGYRGQDNPPDIRFEYVFRHTQKPLLDEERMARALSNILGNAIEAIQVIGKRDSGRVWVHTRDSYLSATQKVSVEIVIGNDGPPFQEEDLPKLFNSFYTKGKKRGTGLGLASVEKILRLHEGKVAARNLPDGSGVEFVLEMPASSEMDDASCEVLPLDLKSILAFEEAAPKEDHLGTWMDEIKSRHPAQDKALKVLLLEDETLYRACVRNVLHSSEELRQRFTLYDADNVPGALALLAQEPGIQWAIVDIDLGEVKNGFDFLREVQNRFPQLACMVHTNRCIEEDKALARQLGAKTFVSKPLDLQCLAEFLACHAPAASHCPVPASSQTPPQADQPAAAQTIDVERTLLCYVADDSTIMRMVMKMHINKAGQDRPLTVRAFDDPEKMLEMAQEESPDIVFSDFHFDGCGLTGFEALTQMKELHPAARLFLVSNVDMDVGLSLAQKGGLSGFIQPPLDSEELAAQVKGIVLDTP